MVYVALSFETNVITPLWLEGILAFLVVALNGMFYMY